MIIIDRNERFFGGEEGETMTVIVKSQNTVHGVTFNLDGKSGVMPSTGPQSSSLTFKLKKAANDPSDLLVLFHFVNGAGGGLYKVLITGSKGGQPFGEVVRQLGNDKVASAGYTFDVL